MEISLEGRLKVTFPESEILMNQHTTWRDKVGTLFFRLILAKLESIFVMAGITLCIGWVLDSMVLKLYSTLLRLLMGCQSHSGESKPEMLLLPIITFLWESTELGLKSIRGNLQVEMERAQRNNLVIFMVALTSLHLMALEPLLYLELKMDCWLPRLIWICACKSKINGNSQWQAGINCMLNCWTSMYHLHSNHSWSEVKKWLKVKRIRVNEYLSNK